MEPRGSELVRGDTRTVVPPFGSRRCQMSEETRDTPTKRRFRPCPANFSDIWGVRRLKQVARAVHEGHGGRCDIPPKAIMASKLALALHECQLRT